MEKNDLSYFPSCKQLVDELGDETILNFSEFGSSIEAITAKFNAWLKEFDAQMSSVLLNNSFGTVIEKEEARFQLELNELQADTFLKTKEEKGPDFFKLLDKEWLPNLWDFDKKWLQCLAVFLNVKVYSPRWNL